MVNQMAKIELAIIGQNLQHIIGQNLPKYKRESFYQPPGGDAGLGEQGGDGYSLSFLAPGTKISTDIKES